MNPNILKHEIVTCRMTEKDYLELREKSELLDMSMSDFIRHLVHLPIAVTQQEGVRNCVIIDNKTMSELLHELYVTNAIYKSQWKVLNSIQQLIGRSNGMRIDEVKQLLNEVLEDMEKVEQLYKESVAIMEEVRDKTFIRGDDKNCRWPLWC